MARHTTNKTLIIPSQPFAEEITPEQAMAMHNKLNPKDRPPLAYWQKLARINCYCSVCHAEPVWRFGQTEDMCFTCTTGESDPSDDYEIAWSGK